MKADSARQRHEGMYQRIVDQFVRNVEEKRFTQERVPRHVEHLRQELGQCIELLLISPEFYGKQMERLGNVLETANV